MNAPSIRRNLLVRCGAGIGILLCLLSTFIYLTVRHGLYKELDHSIEQTAALLSNQVELEAGTITFEWQEGIGTNRSLIDEGLFQYWDETTGKTTRSPGLQSWDLPKFCGPGGAPVIRDIQLPKKNRHARAIGMRLYPFCLPEEMQRMKDRGHVIDPKTLPHILVVARDAKPVHLVLSRLRWILATGTLLTLGIGFALIDRAVRISLRPIDRLTLEVRERAGHQLDAALEVPGELPSELTGLAHDFDALLARVAATRQRERDFIRHAAHELRTPIAALQATTELALSQKRDAEGYAGHLETCRGLAIELGDLVKRLSSLARIGTASSTVTLESIDAETFMEECLRRFIPAFDQRKIRIDMQPSRKKRLVTGDKALLRIIFNNLLDNVAAHAPADSEAVVRFKYSKNHGRISISNPSARLPDDPSRLFEPLFHRNVSGRSDDPHLGIGLTLCLDAALAMGGTMRAEAIGDGRLEIGLRLPIAPPH